MREPCFENLLQVLRREVPDRPTLFELFLNGPLYERLVGPDKAAEIAATTDGLASFRLMMHGYCAAGYDYSTIHGSDFHFRLGEVHMKKTRSLNEGALISDRATFESYPWPDPDTFDYSRLETLASELPEGMKFIVMGPGGVLENVIQMVGYEPLCYMIFDDPRLVQDTFDAVGSRLVRYYEICGRYGSVGAMISNDDWGFKTQTMLSVEDMRRYVQSSAGWCDTHGSHFACGASARSALLAVPSPISTLIILHTSSEYQAPRFETWKDGNRSVLPVSSDPSLSTEQGGTRLGSLPSRCDSMSASRWSALSSCNDLAGMR